MGIKKVQLSTGEVLIDLSNDTITSNKVLDGTRFHSNNGDIAIGNIPTINTNVTLATVVPQSIPSGYYDGTTTVGVEADNIKPENIKKDVDILGIVGSYDAPIPNLQTKTSIPTFEKQYVLPDVGYDYLTEVDVEPIPVREESLNNGIHRIIGNGSGPIASDVRLGSGTFNENGIYNASDNGLDGYSVINVDVPGGISINTPGKIKERFNYPAIITNSVISCSYMFDNCQNFNQPVTIPDSVTTCSYMFQNCYNLNQPITIGNSVTICACMFENCYNFNQPITIPDSVTNCEFMFDKCHSINQPITIPDSVNNCGCMFEYCYNFNQPINIPDSVTNCGSMFYECRNFNQPVTIGNSVTNCGYMFYLCINMSSNIYINQTNTLQVTSMIASNRDNSKPINIFCNNIEILNKSQSQSSLTGYYITWSEITNGYYNARDNIYIYNNYSAETGVIY